MEQDAVACMEIDRKSALTPAAMERTELKGMKQWEVAHRDGKRACKGYSTSVRSHRRKGKWRTADNEHI